MALFCKSFQKELLLIASFKVFDEYPLSIVQQLLPSYARRKELSMKNYLEAT